MKKPGEQHDAERLDADRVHLLDDVLRVERAGEDEANRLAGEAEVLLDRQDLRIFARVVEACREMPANDAGARVVALPGDRDRGCKGKGLCRSPLDSV